MNVNLPELITDLNSLGSVETGFGPRHPASPSLEHVNEIATFIGKFPFVAQDPAYIEFLETYCGLLLHRESDFLTLAIYGFDPAVSLHLLDGEGDIVTEDGFLTFADIAVPLKEGVYHPDDPQVAGFAFDATGERPWGVYRCREDNCFTYHTEDFAAWLRNLVSLRGAWL